MTLVGAMLVGCGSAAGAVARYSLGRLISKLNRNPFPWETWVVNMLGTFLLGLFFEEFSVLHHAVDWWLLSGTGFCGAFTTFSTLSVEVLGLLRQNVLLALSYLGSSLALGIFLAWATQLWL